MLHTVVAAGNQIVRAAHSLWHTLHGANLGHIADNVCVTAAGTEEGPQPVACQALCAG